MKLQLSEPQLLQQIRYFSYYQLVSGASALLVVIVILAQVESLSGLLLLLFICLLSLAGFVIYCGYLTLKRPRQGLQLSRASLLIQFLGFAAGGFTFQFFAGPSLTISLDLTKDTLFKINGSLTGVSLNIASDSDALFVSVNLVALVLFLRTTRWLNEWNARYSQAEAT